jgi:hypothetical protein
VLLMDSKRLQLKSPSNLEFEMVIDQERLALILRALADCVVQASAADVNRLVSGRAKLRIVDVKKTSLSTKKDKHSDPEQTSLSAQKADLENISKRLLELDAREKGIELLKQAQLSRRALESLARTFDLPIRSEDNVERLRDRIVDATIGARLNSQAIRGT